MRKTILFIIFIAIGIYIYLVAAVNHDIRWFSEFSNSSKNERQQIMPRLLKVRELAQMALELHGKSIEVEGWFSFEFENIAVCMERQNEFGVDSCFWLDIRPDPRDQKDSLAIKLRKLSGSWVRLKGIVDISNKGHKGAFLGTIIYEGYIQEKEAN